MRNRRPAAIAATAALLAAASVTIAAGIAEAEPEVETTAAPPLHLITLPTGDAVSLGADGNYSYLPGDDRERIGAISPFSGDGDRLVIPVDAMSSIADGSIDSRLFNIDALSRAGVADARTLDSAAGLDTRGWGEVEASAETVEVTVDFKWLDGSAPDNGSILYMNLETGDRDAIFAEDGVGTAQLPAGEYSFVADMSIGTGENYEYLLSGTDVTVGADATQLTIDGTVAKPVGFETDRDATLESGLFEVTSWSPDGKLSSGTSMINVDGNAMYGIPGETGNGHDYSVKLHAGYDSPQSSGEAYRYNLARTATSIPADPSFVVHDEELARVDADYAAVPGETEVLRSDAAVTAGQGNLKTGEPIAVPSQRTEYYTAETGIEWTQYATIGDFEGINDTVIRPIGAPEPGSVDQSQWFGASPVSVGVGVNDSFEPSGLWRRDAADASGFTATVPLFDDASEGVLLSSQVTGEAVLSKGDDELARGKTAEAVSATLDKGDSGQYTLHTKGTRDVTWTPFGTASTLDWTFDSEPGDSPVVPEDVSVVAFAAEGLTDGYASAGAEQRVSLEFVTQPRAEDRECVEMSFQVSYDDGASWSDVELDRDGDTATATVQHPDDAQFVSVKFTAVDDKGQTVEHSTIRSYGLA